ncbi:restriction endonuclease [Leptolyngbya sp. Heron Island J]|uniref:phosphorothioated DNA-binding restriction endonuclease n=1 Tax=Leptolyngbya sp. Heron Island J TaxID=1385935 RepID=UPI0003B9E38B|nr:HNH endonuclease [Leptolyngbya sp. Heron Island J]ESA37381.1 restriction endonuclease [Leptolyngbya sp. Heron Island J]
MNQEEILKYFSNLNIYRRGNRRAPHKPLLILIAISKFQQGQINLSYEEIEQALKPLLNAYAPPVSGSHQPELPYWYLQSDKLWEVSDAETLPRQLGGFPKKSGLRKSSGRFPSRVLQCFQEDKNFAKQVVTIILNQHFPESLHEDILSAVGITFPTINKAQEQSGTYLNTKKRDPKFRERILRAYEYQCALTGFRAALSGAYFGCEAAHVQWHAYGGPDNVDNGLCLEPTMHKLFDAGAWTLSDEHQVLVSEHFTGSDSAIDRLRALHGQTIRSPLPGQPKISRRYMRWHRNRNEGGVFREPALPLT